MPLIPKAASLWRSLFRASRLDRELDEELRGYFDALVECHKKAGLDPFEARRRAMVEMGAMERIKGDVREARVGYPIEDLFRDVRYAWRGLRKAPTFTAVVVLTLALGIGANTAIFSVVHAILIAPLPYRDSSQLAFVWSDMTAAGYPRAPLSGPELRDLRDRGRLFSGFGAIWVNTATLNGDGDPQQLRVGFVTGNFFSVLGAEAAHGRTFVPGDEPKGPTSHILLSAGVWRRQFGSDPAIVGRRIRINNQPVTVVGVMPDDFKLLMPVDASVPDNLDAWVPFNRTLTSAPRGQQFLRVVGRMRPGVSLEQARREASAIAGQLSKEFTEYGSAGLVLNVVGLQADGVREIGPALLALFAGVVILLSIACVNVASLLIARATSRRREIAVRLALGAGRVHLVRQCVIEGLMLALIGGLAGVAVGYWGLAALVSLRPETMNRIAAARIDQAVLIFTSGTAVIWGLLFSLAPLVEVFRVDVGAAVRRERSDASSVVRQRTRAVLVVGQLALGVVLLIGAGLLVRTFLHLTQVHPGFRSDSVLTFRIALPPTRYRSITALNTFSRELETKVAAVPGVTGVGAVSHLPYDNLPNWGGPYLWQAGQDQSTAPMADYRSVGPDFFRTVSATLMEGRAFVESDDEKGQPIVIVDDGLARRVWPGKSAIGNRLAVDPESSGHATRWVTVVGVVHHIRHRSLMADVREQVYFPARQIVRIPLSYAVHTSADPAGLATQIRDIVKQLDPQLPAYELRLMDDYVAGARATQKFTMIVAAAFASVALLLGCVGVYGVIAYSVARRRHEFGVRLALGAQSSQLVRLVVREGMTLATAGLAIGVGAGLVVTPLLQNQLFGVTPRDLVSYAVAVPVLGMAAAIACWIPARRATRTDPILALRGE